MRRIHLVACAAARDEHCDAIFRAFPHLDELVLDACDWVTDDGLLPLLAATGAQLRSLRLAHWVGAEACTDLPLQVLGDTLAAASASASDASASAGSGTCQMRHQNILSMTHIFNMRSKLL